MVKFDFYSFHYDRDVHRAQRIWHSQRYCRAGFAGRRVREADLPPGHKADGYLDTANESQLTRTWTVLYSPWHGNGRGDALGL